MLNFESFEDMRTRRILHVASGDLWAGAEVQVYHLLRTIGREVLLKVVLMNHGDLYRRLCECGLDVEVIDERRLSPISVLWHLTRVIERFQPEILHTHRYKENLLGQVANLYCGGARAVRTAHGRPEQAISWRSPAKRFVAYADELLGKHATSYTIAVSEELAQSMRESGWRNVRCIPNGIDLAAVRDCQVTPPFVRQSGDLRNIGFVGRLEPVKRADLFIETAGVAVAAGELKYEWHLFGDGSMRAALEARVKEMGIEGKVRFHGHCTDVVKWLRSLDVIVMPSDHEGLPMVLLEALAAGTAVVGHAVGGIKEVLSKITGSALVYEQDPCAYLRAIQALEGARSFAMIEAGQRLVRDQYSVERTAEETLALYADVLDL